jgi:hypothetical protein
MRDLILLLVHVVTTVMRVFQPGGVRAVIAESVLTKHQLLILNRSRQRAPNLRILDRLIAGFCSLWIRPNRRRRLAIAFKPSTFLNFHRAMVQRKYRLLFSPKQRKKPGPKGPTADLDPGGHRDETAQSVMGKSANCGADQFSVRNIY